MTATEPTETETEPLRARAPGDAGIPPPSRSFFASGEFVFLLFLVAYALFMRLYALDIKAVQHDESMFAYYSWMISEKMPTLNKDGIYGLLSPSAWKSAFAAYDYMPILHGPVLEWGNAVVFWLFGDTDYTMRLFNAICGLTGLALVFSLRDVAGKWPIHLAVLFLAVSPTVTYYTRFCRNDIPVHLVYVALIVAAWRYHLKPSALRVAGIVVLLFLATCIKETYTVYYFLIATWLWGTWIHGTVVRRNWMTLGVGFAYVFALLVAGGIGFKLGIKPEDLAKPEIVEKWIGLGRYTWPLFGFGLSAILYPLALGPLLRRALDRKDATFLYLLAGYALVVCLATGYGFTKIPTLEEAKTAGLPDWIKWGRFQLPALALAVGLTVPLFVHGFLVRGNYPDIPVYRDFRRAFYPYGWGLALGLLVAIVLSVFLMTSAFSHMQHAWGQYQAFEYWEGEHKSHRIYGLFHFHWVHHALYELPLTVFWVFCMVKTMWPVRPGPNRLVLRGLFLAWLVGSLGFLLLPAGTIRWMFPKEWGELAGTQVWSLTFPKSVDESFHVQWGLHVWMFAQILFVIMVVGWIRLERREYFRSFLDYWAGGSALAYGYAGEKVPWVGMHIVFPMMISCGFYAHDVWKARFAPLLFPEKSSAPESDAATGAAEATESAAPAAEPDTEPALATTPPRAETSEAGPVAVPSANASSAAARNRKRRKGKSGGCASPSSPSAATPAPEKRAEPKSAPKASPKPAARPAPPRVRPRPFVPAGGGFDPRSPLAIASACAIALFMVPGLLWWFWLNIHVCLIQPASPMERFNYAGMHTEFYSVTNYIVRAAHEQFEGYDTAIAQDGEVAWPLFWTLRRFKQVPAGDVSAVFVVIDNEKMDQLPAYRDRYEWRKRKFRHYWVPAALDFRKMLKIGLLLSPESMLTDEQKEVRRIGRKEWGKLFNGLFLRRENYAQEGGKWQWLALGGYDAWFGRLKTIGSDIPSSGKPEAAPAQPAAAAPPAAPPAAAPAVQDPPAQQPPPAIETAAAPQPGMETTTTEPATAPAPEEPMPGPAFDPLSLDATIPGPDGIAPPMDEVDEVDPVDEVDAMDEVVPESSESTTSTLSTTSAPSMSTASTLSTTSTTSTTSTQSTQSTTSTQSIPFIPAP